MPNLRTLTPLTVARVRSGVVSALICAATDLDLSLRDSLPRGRFALSLAGPSGIRRRLAFDNGRAQEIPGGPGSLVLRFTGAEAMAQALGGGKGTVIPLPLTPLFPKALKAFIASSRRVGELSSRRDFTSESEKRVVTEMLMTAALRGVAETALADPWTAPRSSGMPDGIVEVSINGSDLKGWIERSGHIWRAGRGTPPAKVNARLSFDDVNTAFGLFTGSVVALNALGRGKISIRGKVPMIQILFPLLDRFGEIMAWGKDSRGAKS
jgi:hypothetical protein